MARSRNIKPGFFTNDVLGELPALARLLFAGIWTLCDREGRLEDRPKKIKAEVLPYDECDADDLLQQLHRADFIERYEVDGKRYLQVKTWAEHQNPHMKEAASTIPAPCKSGASSVQDTDKQQPQPERARLIPSPLIPDSSTEPNGSVSGAKAPSTRGSRLAKDWVLPKPWGEWAIAQYPHWSADVVRLIGQTFGNHWKAKSGKDATKLDWEGTWQNWCTSDITQRTHPPPAANSETAYQRSMREKYEQAAPAIAAKRPGAPPAPNPMDVLDGLTRISC